MLLIASLFVTALAQSQCLGVLWEYHRRRPGTDLHLLNFHTRCFVNIIYNTSTMLLGLGIDLLSLPRLEALIKRRSARKLAERICSSCELASFIALPSRLEPSTLQAQELRFLASR